MFIWVRFGERPYGHVEEDELGHHASTRFFHIWYLPLFPIRSLWFANGKVYPTALNGRSIAAVYLRLWAAVAAVVAATTATWAGGALAVVLAGLSAWSWTWRRRPAAQRRVADFDGAAFGMRCRPELMPDAYRAQCKVLLEARWEDRGGGRSPEDVATHGARNADEAVLAYGLLRLAAIDRSIERGGAGEGERAAAARILAGTFDPKHGAGPYREAAPDGGEPVATDPAREQEIANRMKIAAANASLRPGGWRRGSALSPRVALGLLGAITAGAIALALVLALPVLSPRQVTPADLTTWHTGDIVSVTCAKQEPGAHVPVTDRGEDHSAVREDSACTLAGDTSGKVLAMTWQHQGPQRSAVGVIELGAPHDPYAPPSYPVHVRVDDLRFNHLFGATFVLVCTLALWLVVLMRRAGGQRRERGATS